ncbi:MAG: NHLP bacteriocin export ABC transporter permease/ATPase subunit [Phascolarctobacterium sp.]|uniref:NHLP bacteriocin export ABC transporter permease/ATPase subunit n=1 Tax=Phascolarctobacterium sp. TaxID=2049039 RepID=UPI0026DCD506|nr:NHLP bacteriocin export ABC transporter permease/ATPase subunit [Phascolarctobacterium sp.]MDO4920727.1 NHLP bacteriocin export ABC transporter permease/ATPase subunit [Phascolarctobacterium sp.]
MFKFYKKEVLPQGKRFALYGEEQIIQLVHGQAEVYLTRGEEGVDYQQLYLMTVGEGHLVFNVPDNKEIGLYISALEDCEIAFITVAELLQAEPEREKLTYLRRKMNQWFYSTKDCRWLRYSDIYNGLSQAEDVLTGETPEETIWLEFCYSRRLLAAAAQQEFKAKLEQARLSFVNRAQQQDNLMAAAAANLLHTERRELAYAANALEDGGKPVLLVVKAVARYFALPVAKFQDLESSNGDAVSLLQKMLRRLGVYVRLVKPDNAWYRNDSGVLIGFWKDTGEPAALLPDTPTSYKAYSASQPLGVSVDESVAALLQENFFVCYAALTQPKLNLRDLLNFVLRNIWKHDLAAIMLISVIAGMVPLLTPLITGTIFSDIIPINDRRALSTVTQVLLVSAFTMAGIGYARNIAIMRIKNSVDIKLSSGIMLRVLSLPMSFFRKYQVGELFTRIESIHGICDSLMGSSIGAVFNMAFSFWSLALMLYYSAKLTVVALALWFVYLLIVGVIYYNIVRINRQIVIASGKVTALVLQIFNGLNKFRIAGAEKQAYSLWAKLFGEQWRWNVKKRRQRNYLEAVNTVLGFLLPLIIYAMTMHWIKEAAAQGANPDMDYATFLAFQAAFSGFNAVIISVVPTISDLLNIKPNLERLVPVLETVPEVASDNIEVGVLRGDIDLEKVSFRYDENAPMVLDNLTLHIKEGEAVAIVGTSGCGKSTLIRLLLGFEKPAYGAIYYDRYNLEDIDITSVRSQMGVVLQNGRLLTGRIFDNIVGTLPLTREDAWKAAEKVGLDKDIMNMPMGMETIISEGAGNISGGQKQRILLARALVNNPRIIIMDEATSALDNVTQKKVSDSIDAMRVTRIIVAHRLSTVQNVDRILVMDKGRIVESGSYYELINMGGVFASLVKRQLV